MIRSTISRLALLAGLLLPNAVRAQQTEAYVSVDSTRIGDRFELTVVIGHDGSRSPVFPHHLIPDSLRSMAHFALGDFEILDVRKEGGRPYGNSGRLDSVVYEATTFAIDTARVSGIPVGLARSTDTPSDGLATPADTLRFASQPLFLPVVSLLEPTTEDIRDITEVAEFPRSWWPWVLLGLVLAAAIAAWFWYRLRQADDVEAAPAPPPVPPVDVALERLTRLEAIDLRALPDVKSYYVELADILRTYFGQRANVPALEATTRELVDKLTRLRADRPVPRALIRDLHDILDQSDLVKFADIQPVVDRTRAILQQTRETVEKTEAAYRAAEQVAQAERIRAAEHANTPAVSDSATSPGTSLDAESADSSGAFPTESPVKPTDSANPYAPKNPHA
ncbi:MAG: hypothetical protein RIE53_12855 [Rhodothermales bacterium]